MPGLRCLVLSAYCDPATVQDAVRQGVAGYLVKHVRGPALLAAIHRVAAGGTVTVNGMVFRVSYVGGDGNDVTLTRTS